MTNETIKKILDTIFYAILLLLSVRELVLSLLILITKKRYKLFAYYSTWPISILFKIFTGKSHDNWEQNYNKRIYLYAWSSSIGSPLIILACVLQLMITWG